MAKKKPALKAQPPSRHGLLTEVVDQDVQDTVPVAITEMQWRGRTLLAAVAFTTEAGREAVLLVSQKRRMPPPREA